MSKIDLENLTIKKAHQHLIGGDFTAHELSESYLECVKEKNTEINAYTEVFDDVLVQAKNADKEITQKKDKTHALTGIPFAIKDNILIQGKIASCGSRILENHTAAYDATAISKLKKAGAVFLGRANMDEFAMGSSNENSAFGPVKNPHDTTRVPGGSSGGPAAALAMGGALAALGSDTGGSVRQPASFCGVVGLKPTYGAVSRHGLVALASSFDQIGPITKTVEDAEIVYHSIAGKDDMDSTSLSALSSTVDKKKKYTIGVPTYLLEDDTPLEEDVLKNFNTALNVLKEKGHSVKTVDLTSVKYALPVYYIIMPAEASSNLARFDGVRYGLHEEGENLLEDYMKTRGIGFGTEVRRRILLGTYILSAGYYDAYYRKAIAAQNAIRKECKDIFKTIDVIATPTSPTPAFKLGERAGDPLSMYLSDLLTVFANIGGFPAISVPSGTVEREGKSLPLGLQLAASHLHEVFLFDVGRQFEAAR